MAATHGGARPGAGRKKKRQKYGPQVARLEKKLAAHQEKAADNLIKLADGGYERVSEVWKPAGMVQKVVTKQVEGVHGPKVLRFLEPAFPDLDDDEMVCIERKVETADADRSANQYIIDRIAGKPAQAEEDEEAAKEPVTVTDEKRRSAMEKMQQWRQQSQNQLALIRNPLTGEASLDSESTSDATTNPESSMMDDF